MVGTGTVTGANNSGREHSMAKLALLNRHTVEMVAAQVRSHLNAHGHIRRIETSATDSSLHEYFPLWELSRESLEKIRVDKSTRQINLFSYAKPTPLWRYQVHRGGAAIGYVHARHDGGGAHRVTSYCESSDALLIDAAINAIDRSSTEDEFEACQLECAVVGVGAIMLIPGKARSRARACIFRDPRQRETWKPNEIISQAALVRLLLQIRPMPLQPPDR
jgi:hypothetical protein